jgi:hypothetical protein
MFRHHNVSDDHESVALPGLFQNRKKTVAGSRGIKKWKSPVARTSNKVQVMRAIGSM